MVHNADSSPFGARALGLAVGVGLAVGGATSVGQAALADAAGSLANSAGPWALAAFLVARVARRLPVAIGAAIVTMACSEIGYVLVSRLRDISSSSSTVLFWTVAAVLAGVPIGVAAAWTHASDAWRPSAGAGVVAGVLLGEGLYGLDRLRETTSAGYWQLEVAAGMVLVAIVGGRRRTAIGITALLGAAVATATVVYLVATRA